METAINYLTVLPSTKEEVASFASQVIAAVKSGEVNPLTLKAQMKFIQKCFETIEEQTCIDWIREASKYGKSFEYKGWKIEEMEAGVKYDFTECGDPDWKDCCEMERAGYESRKEREKFLRTLSAPITLVSEITGEVVKITPPIRKSTSTLKFTAL